MGQPWPLLSFMFSLFQQTSLHILQQINVKKCPSNLRCRDLNPWPLEHEPPPITTRPGLGKICLHLSFLFKFKTTFRCRRWQQLQEEEERQRGSFQGSEMATRFSHLQVLRVHVHLAGRGHGHRRADRQRLLWKWSSKLGLLLHTANLCSFRGQGSIMQNVFAKIKHP